jgi:cholesterol transport system auxiliary component
MKTTMQALTSPLLAVALLGLAGCSSLRPAPVEAPALYLLDDGADGPAALPAPLVAVSGQRRPTLLVNQPRAAAGYDRAQMAYLRQPQRLEYYAHSAWVDTPARMLGPLLSAALARDAGWRAVVLAPSAARADLRLDTEILRLQQEFDGPSSRLRLSLQATLIDETSHRVLASQTFERSVGADRQDALGGVVAARRATRELLTELARFCRASADSGWIPAPVSVP